MERGRAPASLEIGEVLAGGFKCNVETVAGLGSVTSLVVGEVCMPGVGPKATQEISTNQRADHLSLSSPIRRSGLI